MNFARVIGQRDVRERLVHAAKENRISHALLFLGATGSGNLPLAIAFAQYLVCENKTEDDACNVCSACVKMNKLVHPDVTFSFPVATRPKLDKPRCIDYLAEWREAVLDNPYLNYNDWMESLSLENKQGFISAEESADIVSRLSLKAFEAPYKIVIIWLPEFMNPTAANRLLKIIEEPPEQTLFFLVAENYDRILPTILSRTQLVKVRKIADEDLAAHIVNDSLSRDEIMHLIHRTDGDYNEIRKILLHDTSSSELNNQFLEWMRACLKLNVSVIEKLAAELQSGGREYQKNFFRHALHLIRECLIINYGDRSLIRLSEKDLADFTRFAPFVNSANASQFMEELDKAHLHVERNANWKILFADLSFRLHGLLQLKEETVS